MPLKEAGGGQFEIEFAEGGPVRRRWQCPRHGVSRALKTIAASSSRFRHRYRPKESRCVGTLVKDEYYFALIHGIGPAAKEASASTITAV